MQLQGVLVDIIQRCYHSLACLTIQSLKESMRHKFFKEISIYKGTLHHVCAIRNNFELTDQR
jgi:hypothetical protein